MIVRLIDAVGISIILLTDIVGSYSIFLFDFVKTSITTKLKLKKMIVQMEQIGVDSFTIVVLTGVFAGAVLALQTYEGFKRFGGGQEFIGPLVALAMTRELGPVFTGLMVTGRSGSAITAEIGTMRITEQIDALQTLRINIQQYLVVPRILAGILILPLLSLFCMMCGIIGGYVVCVYILGLNGEEYVTEIQKYLEISDIRGGMIKSSVFGLILTWVGCYKGHHTWGGARGVGQATTRSVVISSIFILIANYFLAVILFTT